MPQWWRASLRGIRLDWVITGWAQMNGLRGPVWGAENMQARVEHDIYYIDNWSVLLDIKIIFLTFFRGMAGENSY